MLTLEPMDKVRVVCLHGPQVERAISSLYEFGAIQVTRSKHGSPDLPLPSFQAISEELIALRAIESLLKSDVQSAAVEPAPLEKLLADSKALRKEFQPTQEALEKLELLKAEETRLQLQKKSLEPFRNLRVSPAVFRKTQKLSFEYGLLKAGEKELVESLKRLPAEASFAREPGKVFALVAFSRENAQVPAVLQESFAQKLEVPETSESSFAAAFEAVDGKIAGLEKEGKRLASFTEEFGRKNSARIARLRADLEEHAKQAELSNKFGKTEFLEMIEGWVPSKRYAEMEKTLSQSMHGKVLVEKVSTRDRPPSQLSNPPVIRRFEFLVSSFSLPDAHELDPTLFIAFTYPFIFGMIFGDIGYGLLTAAIGAFLRAKKQGFLKDVGGMMLLSGAWTIVFGWVFGEFFGGEEMAGLHLTPLIHRAGHGVELLFGLTLVVGIVHLALGFVIGLVANWRAKHFEHAWAKFFWLVVEFAMVAAIYSIVFKQPSLGLPSLAALLIGVAGLYKFEGVQGIVELPGLLSNGLSYLRIMALGLSGVILALIVNKIPLNSSVSALVNSVSGSFDAVAFATSLLMALLFAILLLLGHALALGLGIFESGIQALRLHYVEFFSKFYKGGGSPFIPLREKRV